MPKKTMQKGGGEHRGLINTICFKGLALATPTYSPSTRLPPIPHVPTQMALVLLTQASLGNSGEQKREVSTLLEETVLLGRQTYKHMNTMARHGVKGTESKDSN